jgi:putative Mg2+ transporter-C (MgtC) family protein
VFIDGATFARELLPLLAAYVLALPIGWDRWRAHETRSAGLRTFPIVSVASCAFVLMGHEALGGSAEPMARVLYGIMTGIGFIGGGAILKGEGIVHGTATAASLWSTAAIGAAVGLHRFELAILLSLFTFLTMHYVRPARMPPPEGH